MEGKSKEDGEYDRRRKGDGKEEGGKMRK